MNGSNPFRLAEVWAKLSAARQAVMIEDQAKLLARNHAIVNAHDAKYGGLEYKAPEEPVIQFGDTTNITPSQESTPKPGLSPLVAGLIGAGLLASGIGIPAGAYFIADAIRNIKPSETVVTPVTPGDGNTQYDLRLIP